jgi:hypothetical protein
VRETSNGSEDEIDGYARQGYPFQPPANRRGVVCVVYPATSVLLLLGLALGVVGFLIQLQPVEKVSLVIACGPRYPLSPTLVEVDEHQRVAIRTWRVSRGALSPLPSIAVACSEDVVRAASELVAMNASHPFRLRAAVSTPWHVVADLMPSLHDAGVADLTIELPGENEATVRRLARESG